MYVLGIVYISIGNTLSSAMPTFEVAQAFLGVLGPLFFLFGGEAGTGAMAGWSA